MKKIIKYICIGAVILVGLYFMPFITVKVTGKDGSTYTAPFGTSFVKKENGSVIFESIRSSYAIDKDADNAFYSYGESECYGKKYFYDKENDISYYEHSATGAFPSKLEYKYEEGNACIGWNTDKEIAFEYGDINEVDMSMDKETAIDKGYFVIADDAAVNIGQYNDYSRLVKQGVFSYLRTVIYENNKMVRIIDIQLLEDAKFKVLERDETTSTEKVYVRFSDTEKEDGSKDVCVYEKNYKDAEPVLLFTVK